MSKKKSVRSNKRSSKKNSALQNKKPKLTIKTGIILATALFLLTATAVLGYSKLADQLVKIPLGDNGRGFGVYWEENGEPHVEFGRFGCCAPYCSDMSELECSREYGYDGTFYPGARCDWDVDECRQGCCLPSCQETPKVQCEGDYGYGNGGWLPSACTDVPECEVGCCEMDNIKHQEMKAPCENASGDWTLGECKAGFTVDIEGTSTADIGGGHTLTQTATYHLYTCSETVNSIWIGDGTITTNGKTDYDPDVYFDFESTPGRISAVEEIGGKIRMEGTVTESEMTLSMQAGSLINWTSSAPIKPGAPECQSI